MEVRGLAKGICSLLLPWGWVLGITLSLSVLVTSAFTHEDTPPALGTEVLQVTYLDQGVEKSAGFHPEDACSKNTVS